MDVFLSALYGIFLVDIRTTMVSLFIGNLSLALIVSFYLSSHVRESIPRALKLYCASKYVHAAAWLLLSLRGSIADALSIGMANTLLFFGFFLESATMLELISRRKELFQRVQFVFLVAGLVFFYLVWTLYDSPNRRISVASLVVVLMYSVPTLMFCFNKEKSRFRLLVGIGDAFLLSVLAVRSIVGFVDSDLELFSQNLVQSATFLVSIALMVMNGMSFFLISKEKADLELKELATTDTLTGLSNRRHFVRYAAPSVSYHHRYGLTLTFLFIDIDHFKKINDRFGHLFGDEVLKDLAQIVRTHIRDFDLSCRFGGEEFVVMLNNTGRQEGFTAAERILRMAGDSVFPQMREFRYSISIGLYSAVPGKDDTVETFIAKSDAALYRAKERGRNRIEL